MAVVLWGAVTDAEIKNSHPCNLPGHTVFESKVQFPVTFGISSSKDLLALGGVLLWIYLTNHKG